MRCQTRSPTGAARAVEAPRYGRQPAGPALASGGPRGPAPAVPRSAATARSACAAGRPRAPSPSPSAATFTTSAGSFTKRSASWLTCTRPSWCTPMSTNAPNAVTLVTIPGSFIPGCRSSSFSTPSAKLNASNSSRGSRPGLRQLGQDVVERRQADRLGHVPLGLDARAQRARRAAGRPPRTRGRAPSGPRRRSSPGARRSRRAGGRRRGCAGSRRTARTPSARAAARAAGRAATGTRPARRGSATIFPASAGPRPDT